LFHHWSREAIGSALQDKSVQQSVRMASSFKIGPYAARHCRRLNRRGPSRVELDLVAAAVNLLVGAVMPMGRLAMALMRRVGKLLCPQRG
jgi:hypothetical protein